MSWRNRLRPLHRWEQHSHRVALRNATAGCTELTQRRHELEEVTAFVRAHLDARGGPPPDKRAG
ncbi:MAG: hypothetical protein ACRDPH_16000 [Marmoricola sp.]